MRFWETFRVFAALVTLIAGLAILGWGPILELAKDPKQEAKPRINTSRLYVPAPDPDVLSLPKLVRNRDWRALERMDRWAVEVFEDSSPEMAEHLDAWVAAQPNSAKARMALGMYWRNVGWATRGGRFSKDTHRWQFEGMHHAFGKAVENFEAAARMAPDWAAPHAMLLNIHMAQGDRVALEKAFRAGIAADPTDPLPYRFRLHAASSLWSSKDRADARATRKRILDELGPVEERPERLQYLDGYVPLLEAEIARRDKRHGAANRHFKEAYMHGPFFAWKYANFLRRQEQNAKAARMFVEAIEGRPFGATKYMQYARLLRRQGALDKGVEAIEFSLAIDPYDDDANREAGYLAQAQGRHKDALAYFERALFYGGYWAPHWSALAYHRMNYLGDPNQAAADYAMAAELSPDYPGYTYSHALALGKADDCRAVPAFRRYLALCERSGKCKPNNVDRAELAWRQLVDLRYCEESGAPVSR